MSVPPVLQVEPNEIDEESNEIDEESIQKAVQMQGVTIAPEYWEDESKGLKQDVEHIFIRLKKRQLKSHRAFGVFIMARLSDTFFCTQPG